MAPLTGDPKSHSIPTSTSSSSSQELKAHCLCHSITVSIKDPSIFKTSRSLICHCSNCRASSGSFVSTNLVLDAEAVEITEAGLAKGSLVDEEAEGIAKGEGKGRLRVFRDEGTGSGKAMMRSFCDRCGSPIKSESETFPGKVILKMGIFPRIPAPAMEVFASHRQEWETRFQGAQAYKIAPDGEKMDD